MNPTMRGSAMQVLAELLDKQIAAIRARDLESFMATQAPMEAACARLRRERDETPLPLERAWAATVRRLAATVHVLLAGMRQPWADLVKEVVGPSADRASPVSLDLHV
jgi:hypothetical protein